VSRTINALERGQLQRGLQLVTKDVEKLTREISGADSEPVKKAALVLRKEWRRLLGNSGGGKPSSPGAPPAKQSGRLQRSIKTAIVNGVRRIGTDDFRSWMTEFGTDQAPPRPHARPAVENSAQEMAEVLISESQGAVEKSTVI
jgi:HK97 gp10 family phage protein